MTPEEQWEIINTASFDTAVFTKIKSVVTAMASAEIEADELRTNVNDVPVKFSVEDVMLRIAIGTNTDNSAQVRMEIPAIWLES
jgi:hypothetical protein